MFSGRHAAALAVALVVGAESGADASNGLFLAAERPGDRAFATVRTLARERPAGSAGERKVAAVVAARLRSLGYRVSQQSFRLPRGGLSRNVVGRTAGPVRVIVAAHMDGVARTVAANDNASGVAVLLELAAALAERGGVLIAGLGAEERHETGSPFHLGSLRLTRDLPKSGVRLAVVLDMVGVGTRLHVRGIEAWPNASARALLRSGRAAYLRDPGHSDHAELTRAGIPAAWVQWREDACWHRPCDVASRVRPRKLEAAYVLVLRAADAALRSYAAESASRAPTATDSISIDPPVTSRKSSSAFIR
jgi:aminopeptidase YwaD